MNGRLNTGSNSAADNKLPNILKLDDDEPNTKLEAIHEEEAEAAETNQSIIWSSPRNTKTKTWRA